VTESQQHGVAAGFLHILQTHSQVYEKWMHIPKDDYLSIGTLIKEEMGLSTAPDVSDFHAMATYVDAQLKGQVSAIQSANANAPRHVGFLAAMQQNS